MTITIGWGSYGEYEGPFYRGSVPLKPRKDPDFLDEAMYVFSRTEGKLDSLNMYDSCILSIGCAQWCMRLNFAYSAILGMAHDVYDDKNPIDKLHSVLSMSNATFEKRDDAWKFYIKDVPVTSKAHLQQLFFHGASGKKGSWTKSARALAMAWAESIVLTLREESMIGSQIEYTKPRMMNFVVKQSRDYLFGNDTHDDDVGRCAKTAYLTFAGNNPKWANDTIKHFSVSTETEKWSEAWLCMLLKELTFRPNVAIYPHRYDAIAPALREVYDVNIPRTSLELRRYEQVKVIAEKQAQEEVKDIKPDEGTVTQEQPAIASPPSLLEQNTIESKKDDVIIKASTNVDKIDENVRQKDSTESHDEIKSITLIENKTGGVMSRVFSFLVMLVRAFFRFAQ